MTKTRNVRFAAVAAASALLLVLAGNVVAEDWALLIGASQYPNLPKERWLRGPTNDVALVRILLLDKRTGFREDHLMVLSGWPENIAARPTRVNILQALQRLSNQCKKDDQVFVLFSGHGSQQPDRPTPGDIEPDGLDEIFLPADISGWDEKEGTVKNALIDDEVHAWTEAMTKKGVFVWMVFDSCNSGTMTRDVGVTEQQVRRVDMKDLVPASVLAQVKEQPATTRGAGIQGGAFDMADNSGGLVAIYAAQPFETTFETPLPGKSGSVHGMLTYTIAKTLALAEGKFTYRQLADRVLTIYRALGVTQPTPFIEGSALDRVVLGKEMGDARSSFFLTGETTSRGHVMNAGTLQGLRPGTILDVFPPAGLADSGKSIGYVKVAQVDAVASIVAPIKYEGRAAPRDEDLGAESRCRIVQEEFGLPPIHVTVQNVDPKSGAAVVCAKDAVPRSISATLKTLGERGLADAVYKVEDADWLLRVNGKQAVLIPATGWQTGRGSGKPPSFAVGDPADEKAFPIALRDRLARIARALRLIRIAAGEESGSARPGATRVTAELLRYDSPESGKATPVMPAAAGRVLRSGDTIAFRLANPSDHPIDVTLMFVDSGYGIQAIFPEPGTVEDNRLFPGQERITPKVTVTADTVGAEQVVAIAVKASRERVDFSCLQQEALEQTRGTRALGESPLGNLLVEAMFGEGGGTRGLKRAPLPFYNTVVIPWQTLPAE